MYNFARGVESHPYTSLT